MAVPQPTPILRLVHADNLNVYLRRSGLHAPNFTPNDGLIYKTIHNTDIQAERRKRHVRCGPCGNIHDYIPFYFGPLSPMMLQLKTGQVQGYNEGQEPLIYLLSTAQAIQNAGIGFVFSDGHGIAAFTSWFDDLDDLHEVDWGMVNERYWADNNDDMDRQRRKQAEFLVHEYCPWSLIHEIIVINNPMKSKVERVLAQFEPDLRRNVNIKTQWYYH